MAVVSEHAIRCPHAAQAQAACAALIEALDALGSDPQFATATSQLLQVYGDLQAWQRSHLKQFERPVDSR